MVIRDDGVAFAQNADPGEATIVLPTPAMIFARQLCGVDGSQASLAAAAQGARLAAAGADVLVVFVADPWNPPITLADSPGPALLDVEEHGTRLLEEVAAQPTAARVRTELLQGWAPRALLDRARQERSDLIALGMHGRRRSTAYFLGSVATTILHEASCSVFVARERELTAFPRSVVVGVDGSPHSAQAVAVAQGLAARFGADVRAVTATGSGRLFGRSPGPDLDAARRAAPTLEVDSRQPAEALVGVARDADADLLIVGARGLRGLRAIGSVSERVAHEASCSVVVVRSAEDDAADA
jgi:nucleotide-binding universal stress UspA family protein